MISVSLLPARCCLNHLISYCQALFLYDRVLSFCWAQLLAGVAYFRRPPPLHAGPLPRGPLPCAGLLHLGVPTAPAENGMGARGLSPPLPFWEGRRPRVQLLLQLRMHLFSEQTVSSGQEALVLVVLVY